MTSQETYGLHRHTRRRFKRPRVMVSGIGKQAYADLMDMTELSKYIDGVRFVLLHIDDFSRFIRTVPLKSKTGKGVAQALETIFNKIVQKLLKKELSFSTQIMKLKQALQNVRLAQSNQSILSILLSIKLSDI